MSLQPDVPMGLILARGGCSWKWNSFLRAITRTKSTCLAGGLQGLAGPGGSSLPRQAWCSSLLCICLPSYSPSEVYGVYGRGWMSVPSQKSGAEALVPSVAVSSHGVFGQQLDFDEVVGAEPSWDEIGAFIRGWRGQSSLHHVRTQPEDGKNTPRCPLITDQPQGGGKYVSIVHIVQHMVLLAVG